MNFRTARPEADVRIELTPLIDVVFQLLIFFLLTTSFIHERSMQVDLPEARIEKETEAPTELLAITIAADGTVAHGETPVSWDELTDLFGRAAANDPTREVMIRGDRAVPHGRVIQVMDLAQRHGLTKMAIATVAADEDTPAGGAP
ncbi:MAG: biopolymer transporter ExbD [Myxococcales bacterium]|nr:biopolymer transporter ExbD [Myxococcales bacterium]MDD9967002.1 biopolymer transporter ExbD [Myxococcales bacterium]